MKSDTKTMLGIPESTTTIPPLTHTIVNKIFERNPGLQQSAFEIYDILSQALEQSSNDATSYYERAYRKNPALVSQLYRQYSNTDEVDLHEIYSVLTPNLAKYGASKAYLEIVEIKSTKKISTWEELLKRSNHYLPPDMVANLRTQAKHLGENNIFEIYVFIEPEGLRVGMGAVSDFDGDVLDEENSANSHRYSRPLRFYDMHAQIAFIRKRSGKDGDLQSKVIYE